MSRNLRSLAALFVLGVSMFFAPSAYADTIYTFSGTTDGLYPSGPALTGTVTISTAASTYTVTGGSFTYANGDVFSTLSSAGTFSGGNYFYGNFADPAGDSYFVAIIFPPNGSGVYTLCALNYTSFVTNCGTPSATSISSGFSPTNGAGGYDYSHSVDLGSGTLVPPPVLSAVPEPSSLFLLGTGMVGAAAVARRRFAQA